MMAHPELRKLWLFKDDIHLTNIGHVVYSDILIHYTRQYIRQLYMEHLACEAWEASKTAGAAGGSAGSSTAGSSTGTGAHAHHASPEVCSSVALAFATARGEKPAGAASAASPYGLLNSTYVLPGWDANVQFYT